MASSADDQTIKEEEEEDLRGAEHLQLLPTQSFPGKSSASGRIEILLFLFFIFLFFILFWGVFKNFF